MPASGKQLTPTEPRAPDRADFPSLLYATMKTASAETGVKNIAPVFVDVPSEQCGLFHVALGSRYYAHSAVLTVIAGVDADLAAAHSIDGLGKQFPACGAQAGRGAGTKD